MVKGDRIMSVYKRACNPLICIRTSFIDTCMLAFRWFVTHSRTVVTTYDCPAATNLVVALTGIRLCARVCIWICAETRKGKESRGLSQNFGSQPAQHHALAISQPKEKTPSLYSPESTQSVICCRQHLLNIANNTTGIITEPRNNPRVPI